MSAVSDRAGGGVAALTLRRRLARSALLIGGATVAANVLNALFQLAMARILDPGEYSLLATLFAVVLVPGVPMLAVQTVVARDVASRLAADDVRGAGAVLVGSVRALLRIAPPLAAVGLVIGLPLGYLLNVQRPLPIAGTVLAVALSLVLPILYGGLQGKQRFDALGGVQLLHVVLKLALCLALGLAGAGVVGVMFGLAAAGAATLVASAWPLRGLFRAARGARTRSRRLLTRYGWGSAAALTAFAALTQLDVAVARSFFSPETAGAYAAATITAKILLIAPTAVTTVLFPHVATLDNKRRERRALRGGLLAVGALGSVAALVLGVFSTTTIDLLFGSEYARGGDWLGVLAVVMTLYGLGAVYLFHHLSLGRSGFAVVPAAVLALQLAGYLAFHGEPREIVAVQLAAAALLVVGGEVYELRAHRRP